MHWLPISASYCFCLQTDFVIYNIKAVDQTHLIRKKRLIFPSVLFLAVIKSRTLGIRE